MKYTCQVCGKEKDRRPQQKNTYCSNKCQGKEKRARTIERWLSGESSGSETTTGKLLSTIKKYVRSISGNKCSLCGWGEINPVTGTSPVEVDHIDGNWANNKPDNLRVLCPNCHALQPTHKGLNRGKGRPYRIRY